MSQPLSSSPSPYTFTYKAYQAAEEIRLKENTRERRTRADMAYSFGKTFVDLSFCELQEQTGEMSTDDDCIHFLHMPTGDVYSWERDEKMWLKAPDVETSWLKTEGFFGANK